MTKVGILAIALAAACSAPAPEKQQTPPIIPPHPGKPVAEPNIRITEAVAGNPVIVRGRARTFENTLSIRVKDGNGRVLAEDFTTSVGEMGQFNPFEAELWLTGTPGPRIFVEAFEYSAKDGSEQSRDSLWRLFTTQPIAVKLVFPLADCTKFETFERFVPKSAAMARLLVEVLLAGPTEEEKAKGATSPFPKGSDVKSVILRDGVLTVDFTERLQNVGGSCAALAIREAVTRTLRQLSSVKSVVITAGGSEKLALQP